MWLTWLVLLVGCGNPPVARDEPVVAPLDGMPADFPLESYTRDRGGKRWRIDQGLLTVQVGKTGPLARLGHHHMVHSTALAGYAALGRDGALRADVYVPMQTLQVDDAEMRAKYLSAEDNGSTPDAQAIAATRANMLGDQVLAAGSWPYLRARLGGTRVVGAAEVGRAGRLPMTLATTIAGTVTTLNVELEWQPGAQGIEFHSTFSVDHQALGLTPFSALGGALRVADTLQVSVSGRAVELTR